MSSSLRFQLILIVELFRLIFTIKTELGVFIIDIFTIVTSLVWQQSFVSAFFCSLKVISFWDLFKGNPCAQTEITKWLRPKTCFLPGSLSPGTPYPLCLQLCLARVNLLSSIHLLSMPGQENWRKAQGRNFGTLLHLQARVKVDIVNWGHGWLGET